MRTAIVSDIHGNSVALEALLAELEHDPVDQVVCLGDHVQGGPEPTRCLERVLELGWPVALGNADAFLLDPATADEGIEPITEAQLAVREWTLGQLAPEHVAAIERFAPRVEVELGDGRTLLACHAAPGSYHPLILPSTPEEEFRALLDGWDHDVIAGGHVHLQFVRRRGDTLFLNPGSVGLSYDHEQDEDDFRFDPWAAYAVVTAGDGRLGVELRRIPVDVEAIKRALLESGMPGADGRIWRWDPRPAAGSGSRC